MAMFEVYPRFGINLQIAKGVYIWDENNNRYLDLYGGHGVISIGHHHVHYNARLKAQLDKIGFYSNSVEMPIQNELAQKLAKLSGYEDHNLFLCNSGAEAIENALKIASFHTKKKKIIAFKGSFHGRTAAALNITDNPKISSILNTNNFPVEFIDLNEPTQLDNVLKTDDVCAVIVEGIQGVGGLEMPTANYWQYLANKCQEKSVLLIADEIQSGYGRTGKFFAHQYAQIKADIVTLAKGMGNGFPIGGVLIHPDIQAENGLLGTTFGGNYLACAAGLAVLETIEKEQLMANAIHVSDFLKKELASISVIKKIKGKGLMMGIEFDFPIKKLRKELLFEYNIFTGASANPNLLRILPPLCIKTHQIEPFLEALKKADYNILL